MLREQSLQKYTRVECWDLPAVQRISVFVVKWSKSTIDGLRSTIYAHILAAPPQSIDQMTNTVYASESIVLIFDLLWLFARSFFRRWKMLWPISKKSTSDLRAVFFTAPQSIAYMSPILIMMVSQSLWYLICFDLFHVVLILKYVFNNFEFCRQKNQKNCFTRRFFAHQQSIA